MIDMLIPLKKNSFRIRFNTFALVCGAWPRSNGNGIEVAGLATRSTVQAATAAATWMAAPPAVATTATVLITVAVTTVMMCWPISRPIVEDIVSMIDIMFHFVIVQLNCCINSLLVLDQSQSFHGILHTGYSSIANGIYVRCHKNSEHWKKRQNAKRNNYYHKLSAILLGWVFITKRFHHLPWHDSGRSTKIQMTYLCHWLFAL